MTDTHELIKITTWVKTILKSMELNCSDIDFIINELEESNKRWELEKHE